MTQNLQKSTVYNLRLDAELYNAISTIAEREQIPLSFVIRRAIKKGLGMTILAKEQERISLPENWE